MDSYMFTTQVIKRGENITTDHRLTMSVENIYLPTSCTHPFPQLYKKGSYAQVHNADDGWTASPCPFPC